MIHLAEGIDLEQTCGACPEQYDAYLHGELIGYLRLRHGWFTVSYPNVGGEEVYSTSTDGDGMFEDYERDYHLTMAKVALITEHNRRQNGIS